MSAKSMLENYAELVENRLKDIVASKDAPQILKDSIAYSLLGSGKRIRPALTLELYRILGGNPEEILDLACAVEMIHTYSLIHDDLPCMDDDDLRRGKPSNHKAFSEDIALLAGDALLTLAFETASVRINSQDASKQLKAVNYIADAAGMCKMVGGQVLDLQSENKKITLQELEKLQDGKTVAMLKLPAYIACTLIGADEETTSNALLYCENIGKAFQIRDDILDVIADERELGKPIGSDVKQDKNTYVSLLGLDFSQEKVDFLSAKAIESIKKVSNDNENLVELCNMLSSRKK